LGGSESVLNQQISLTVSRIRSLPFCPPGFEFPLSVKDPLVWTTVRVKDPTWQSEARRSSKLSAVCSRTFRLSRLRLT
jgi:hypothetical protein